MMTVGSKGYNWVEQLDSPKADGKVQLKVQMMVQMLVDLMGSLPVDWTVGQRAIHLVEWTAATRGF